MRAPHKVAHAVCPNGAKDWYACDRLEKYRFGQCKAVVGDKEPTPCSRWAVGEEGWCWQHYSSELERIKRDERSAEAKLQLVQQIDEFIARTKLHPSIWDGEHVPGPSRYTAIPEVVLAPAVGVEPTAVGFGDRGAAMARRKGPHRVG